MKKYFVMLLLMLTQSVFGQYEDTGKRGNYFPKKVYSPVELPEYNSVKDKLPQPVLTDNPEYLDLYWKTWQLAFAHLKKPLENSPFVSNYIDEAFSPSIFQWDTIFMIMFAKYAHFVFPSIESLDNFYSRQYENGYICRQILEDSGDDKIFEGREHTINPPLFAWAEIEYAKLSGDKDRFKNVLPVLEKYSQWLEKFRRKENTIHGLFWQTGLGSGMDNTPRSGSGWVDMSVQMVMLYDGMAFMSEETGELKKAEKYTKRKNELTGSINKYMWNEEDGLYYNVDDEGRQVKHKTIASFWPLLADICDETKAEKLMQNLMDTETFWRKVPFPTLAADEKAYRPDGQYWLGGVWAPTNVMVMKGLDKFSFRDDYKRAKNFREFAAYATAEYLTAMNEVFKRTGTIWENYAPDFYLRGNISRPDFVGWSGCGPVQLLIENILGFHPNAYKNEMVWYLNRIDEHGIRNLKFGDVTTTIICTPRESIIKPAKVTVTSDKEYKIIVYNGPDKSGEYLVNKGVTELFIQ